MSEIAVTFHEDITAVMDDSIPDLQTLASTHEDEPGKFALS